MTRRTKYLRVEPQYESQKYFTNNLKLIQALAQSNMHIHKHARVYIVTLFLRQLQTAA